jgi:riboflavin synthase
MFSGIVEDMGTVVQVRQDKPMTLWDGREEKGTELTIKTAVCVDSESYIGCSIAVNGVCLTATSLDTTAGTVRIVLTPSLGPEIGEMTFLFCMLVYRVYLRLYYALPTLLVHSGARS